MRILIPLLGKNDEQFFSSYTPGKNMLNHEYDGLFKRILKRFGFWK